MPKLLNQVPGKLEAFAFQALPASRPFEPPHVNPMIHEGLTGVKYFAIINVLVPPKYGPGISI